MFDKDPVPAVCQAEDCTRSPEYACEAWVMTPPFRGYVVGEIALCGAHAAQFETRKRISVLTDPHNLDLVSAAVWRDGEIFSEGS